ncbi:hypothetical protein IAU60_003853 [Kwoniella sp. DSM 27419]
MSSTPPRATTHRPASREAKHASKPLRTGLFTGAEDASSIAERIELAMAAAEASTPPAVGTPTHILEGRHDFTIPHACVQGTAPPLTTRPFQLSRGYQHLVESPEEHKTVIREKVDALRGWPVTSRTPQQLICAERTQSCVLPQLGSDDLRQARADVAYLQAIVNQESKDVAQIRASLVWAARA